jgi:hypothetical protein
MWSGDGARPHPRGPTTSLHDRLADLAEAAPAGASPPELWERDRRYGRRSRVEAVALTVVPLAAVGSLLRALLPAVSYDAGPADTEASPRLPDRLEHPGGWTKGADEVGSIGPLVAIFTASRSTKLVSRTHTRLVGVSASGDYAFLDLPGAAQVPAASPTPRALRGRAGSRNDGSRTARGRPERSATVSADG